MIYDLSAAPPAADQVAAKLRELHRAGLTDDRLLPWCEQQGLIPTGVVAPSAFADTLQLRRRHFRLLEEHRPSVITAPIECWWADAPPQARAWATHTRAGVQERQLEATHFTIMTAAHLERIAADIRTWASDGAPSEGAR
jgi:thioesterase domain-containing protein